MGGQIGRPGCERNRSQPESVPVGTEPAAPSHGWSLGGPELRNPELNGERAWEALGGASLGGPRWGEPDDDNELERERNVARRHADVEY